MEKTVFALILILSIVFIIGCKGGNNITGRTTEEVISPDSCEDTEDGINKEIRGEISGFKGGEEYEISDECIGGFLMEHYCEGEKPVNQNFRCGGKCSDGACVQE